MSVTGEDLRSQLATDLPGAAARGEIVAFYQPQVDVPGGSVVGAEALSRWFHPRFGLIPPDVFIPLAEAGGSIGEIGDHILNVACEFGAAYGRRGTAIDISVNVSAIQLRDENFTASVLGAAAAHGLDSRYLIIEVTETEAVLDVIDVGERFHVLRSAGVTVSVDDFGSGQSSIEQLLGLQASELKIDRSVVQNYAEHSRILLAAVISFAHDRGLRVVAEGVETAVELAAMTALGCDRVQGYLTGRAMPASEFDQFLSASRST